jgi:hypothetical protein
MNFKRLTCGSAIALAIGASVLTAGSGSRPRNRTPRRANSGIARAQVAPVDRADTIKGPAPGGHDQGHPPGGQGGPGGPGGSPPPGRPIRAGAASMTAGAITSRSTTTGAG